MRRVAFRIGVSFLAAGLLLGSCAPRSAVPDISAEAIQSEAAQQLAFRFENLLKETGRVHNVSYAVLSANRDQCKKVGAMFGMSVHSLKQLPEEVRALAGARLGLERQVGIVNVVPGSPAAKARLRRGDLVLKVSGAPVPPGRGGANQVGKILRESKPNKNVYLVVSRAGKKMTVTMRGVRGCAYPVFLAGKKETNAFTDGSRIVVQRGMLTLAASDEELALVIGHELAHITARHLQKKSMNKVAGTFGGLALDLAAAAAGINTGGVFSRAGGNIGGKVHSQDFETEADYIGMYFVTRAGYNTKGVEKFWRKMADSNPRSIAFAGTHPTSAERFLVITKTHQEIQAKRRAKQPILPNQVARR